MPNWTFDDHTFTWLRSDTTLPTWNRTRRRIEQRIVGTGDTELNYIGYDPWRISGRIWMSQSEAGELILRNGELHDLDDGTRMISAELQIEASTLAPNDVEGYTAQVTFTSPQSHEYADLPKPF